MELEFIRNMEYNVIRKFKQLCQHNGQSKKTLSQTLISFNISVTMLHLKFNVARVHGNINDILPVLPGNEQDLSPQTSYVHLLVLPSVQGA